MLEIGDLVFAKLKGHRHPHWPAVVIDVFKLDNKSFNAKSRASFLNRHSFNEKSKTGTPFQSAKKRKVKVEAPHDMINVKFFGTGQTAYITADSVVLYNDDSVERFNTANNRKHRLFKDALEEIAEMKSKIEFKSSKHLSRITRSAVKNVVNRKREETKHKFMTNKQDEKQLDNKPKDPSFSVVDTSTLDKVILPGESFEIVNLLSPTVSHRSKKRARSSSSSLSIPMDIFLSSPTKDTQSGLINIPVSNHFNHQDITLSSPVANHHDQDDISVFSAVTNHPDIALTSNTANQGDIYVFNPVTNHPDIALSSHTANQGDISVVDPVTNLQDNMLSFSGLNHHTYANIAKSTPLLNHPDLQDIPVTNLHNQQDHQDLQDTSVPVSVVNQDFEESFSCEENPCELSWVEPSLPEDLDDSSSSDVL